MTKILIRIGVVLSIAFASPGLFVYGSAAEAGDARLLAGGAGYFVIGGQTLDLGGLNAAMKGYSNFSGGFFTLGGGGHAVIGRLVLGGEGHGLLEKHGGNSSYRTSLSGGFAFFDIGWVAYAGRGFRVYPLFGLGAGSVSLDISDRSRAAFEDVLLDPKRSVRLQTSGFLLNLAVAVERWLGDSRRRGKARFFIGARAGYVFAPARSGWELEKMEITGGPKLNISGPYLRLVIGAGSPGIR